MSLLLTRHVDEYRIDVHHGLRFRPDRLCVGRCEPLTDQLTMKPIMLDDQHALHGWLRR
jgi:hypothetical protein